MGAHEIVRREHAAGDEQGAEEDEVEDEERGGAEPFQARATITRK